MRNLSTTSVASFWDELEKLAGPRLIEEPGLLSTHGIGGLQIPASHSESQRRFPGGTRESIVVGSESEYAPGARKAALRHEIAHYLRRKRGHMAGVGDPGLRNVAKTLREELIAYGTQFDQRKTRVSDAVQAQMSQHLIPNLVQSMESAYPKGVIPAALGGNFGRALRTLRLIK